MDDRGARDGQDEVGDQGEENDRGDEVTGQGDRDDRGEEEGASGFEMLRRSVLEGRIVLAEGIRERHEPRMAFDFDRLWRRCRLESAALLAQNEGWQVLF